MRRGTLVRGVTLATACASAACATIEDMGWYPETANGGTVVSHGVQLMRYDGFLGDAFLAAHNLTGERKCYSITLQATRGSYSTGWEELRPRDRSRKLTLSQKRAWIENMALPGQSGGPFETYFAAEDFPASGGCSIYESSQVRTYHLYQTLVPWTDYQIRR